MVSPSVRCNGSFGEVSLMSLTGDIAPLAVRSFHPFRKNRARQATD